MFQKFSFQKGFKKSGAKLTFRLHFHCAIRNHNGTQALQLSASGEQVGNALAFVDTKIGQGGEWPEGVR
jgi:hypothetical protein